MKKDIHHKDYRAVVFKDTTNDFAFLTRSTAATEQTIKWEDGNEYPLIEMYISSASHPFYTGKEKLVDIEGRVDRFKAKAAKAEGLRSQAAAKAAKQEQRRSKTAPSEKSQKLGDKAAKPTPAQDTDL